MHHDFLHTGGSPHAAGALFYFFPSLPLRKSIAVPSPPISPQFELLPLHFSKLFSVLMWEAQSPVYNVLLWWRHDKLWFWKCWQTAIWCKCGKLWQTNWRPSRLHYDPALQCVCPQPWRNCTSSMYYRPVLCRSLLIALLSVICTTLY